MRVGFLQFSPVWGDRPANLATVTRALATADADLMVLPELCTTGYQLTRSEALELSEPFPGGRTCEVLAALSASKNMHVVAGVIEREGDRVFNASVLVGPDGLVARYRKVHLFEGEKDVFDPGDIPFPVAEAGGARIGMMICFDWAFPEAARSLALAGADLVAHPSNLVLPFCQHAMPVRCLENGIFAITANRTGSEERLSGRPALRFTGNSLVAGPRGEVLARAPDDGADMQVVEIDPARARDKMLTARNDLLADRRPELYRLGR